MIRTAAASAHWKNILNYVDDPIVSSDIIKDPHSGTFDSLATMVLGREVGASGDAFGGMSPILLPMLIGRPISPSTWTIRSSPALKA